MPDEAGPLGPADLEELKLQLGKLDQADREIDKAVRAGLDMTGQKTRVRELREQLTKVRQSYFPGQ
jgi:hypothetical protein